MVEAIVRWLIRVGFLLVVVTSPLHSLTEPQRRDQANCDGIVHNYNGCFCIWKILWRWKERETRR